MLDEVSLADTTGVRLAAALVSAIPEPRGSAKSSQLLDERDAVTYDSGHVLPFVADSLAVTPRPAIVGYVGRNAALRGMLQRVVGELAEGGTLTLVTASDEASAGTLAETADLLIVDFGLDADDVPAAPGSDRGSVSTDARGALRPVIAAFQFLVERERTRLRQGRHPRRFVLVNSRSGYTDAYVLSNLDCSHTTVHSRVRRATVKPNPTMALNPLRDLSWDDPLEAGEPLILRPDEPVEIARLDSGRGFAHGWAFPDATAVWTRGPRAELRLASGTPLRGPHDFTIAFGRVGVPPGDTLDVDLSVDGTRLASSSFPGGTRTVTWRTRIPERLAGEAFRVVLEFEEPPYWHVDDRMLGLHVRSIAIERGGLTQRSKRVATTFGATFAHLGRELRARSLSRPRPAATHKR